MTSYPIGIFIVAALALGQDGGASRMGTPEGSKPPAQTPAQPAVVHKLDSVSWNPASKELSWVVSVWDISGPLEKPIAKRDYTVMLDSATMKSNGETRGFDAEEARQVRIVMDMISAYAVGSTVWWERGMGEKIPPAPNSKDNKDKNETKPTPSPSPRPASHAVPGSIASARH